MLVTPVEYLTLAEISTIRISVLYVINIDQTYLSIVKSLFTIFASLAYIYVSYSKWAQENQHWSILKGHSTISLKIWARYTVYSSCNVVLKTQMFQRMYGRISAIATQQFWSFWQLSISFNFIWKALKITWITKFNSF